VRLSSTLSVYIGRHFILSFMAIFTMFMMLIFLFDSIELLRRAASKPNVSFAMVAEMAIMKLPSISQEIFPFSALFGTMVAFWRLTRNHELVIIRTAGVSVWQFLLPVIGLALALGIFQISVINPLASTTLSRFERLEINSFKGARNQFAFSGSGIWLRQADKNGQSVIHAGNILQQSQEVELRNIFVMTYSTSGEFLTRIDAKQANLEDGFWYIKDAWIHETEQPPRFAKEYWLETNLTLNKIQDNFASPETMSFWDLPEFISTLEKAGFSALRHRLYWNSLLAAPFLMIAMVLIATAFTLRQSRRGGVTYVITAGVLTGFLLYFFSDVIFALGLSDSIPVTLAAWTPSGVALLLGTAFLFHIEDG